MQQPLVSVLIPVYNVEPFLGECIGSIINQTYRNLQVVLIDDGSKDRSWQIMQDYAARDERIEVYSQPNSGVAETRNRLLDKARGEFVVFVDSDDWIDAATIEELMRKQQEGDYDMVSYGMVAFTPDDVKNGRNVSETPNLTLECESYTHEESIMHFLEHINFRGSLCSKVVRRCLFDGKRFGDQISYGEDALMCWQVLQQVNGVRILPNRFYHYRMNGNSISHSKFDDRQFSAYRVWKQICADTERLWPQYLDIARARFAIEMTLLLRSAARSNYDNRDNIAVMQQVVKDYGPLIAKTHLSSWKMSAYAWLAGRSFALTRLITH